MDPSPAAGDERAPLDPREREYLRSKQELRWPASVFFSMPLGCLACFVPGFVFEPEMRQWWVFAMVGAATLFLFVFALSIYYDEMSLREDVAAGVKLWREGRIDGVTVHDDGETWPPIYRLYIAFDGSAVDSSAVDGSAIDGEDAEQPLGFSVPLGCYDAVEPGDRVRIAYSPKSRLLLNLIAGDYRYVAVDRQFDPPPPRP
ncbi:hypothetical protein K4L06_13100 [Lysobacter sp. BMK333-48F3]|uniref:hypothetical protein n=1 Tax=Lysobacter sp. BMK333-48F3 TaxID=2867962 RepID=UPI001C8B2381|nr:hypothetical protein [Lysobacter sp. BMK333-48F3]MBX9402245.1 hypothetical protein [Lysobacter sp. BMK333-48F3]